MTNIAGNIQRNVLGRVLGEHGTNRIVRAAVLSNN